MRIIRHPKRSEWTELLQRPIKNTKTLKPLVQEVFEQVAARGDTAIRDYTKQFDGVSLQDIEVSKEVLEHASSQVSKELKKAINMAKAHITSFHTAQKTPRVEVTTAKGVTCSQDKRPIQKVGLYIPGGTAPLFSTVLMLAIPAQIAGCKQVILCSPPNQNGQLPPEIIYTAQLCGIHKLFKVGGIQSIAAMTFGTTTIPQVDKIFGPGNQYVTAAKQLAISYGIAIDMPAGPSELLVMTDDTAISTFVAADLLSQAEHGADSQVILVSTSEAIIASVIEELEQQIAILPRKAIVKKAMVHSKAILVDNHMTAIDLINNYAPEHLIVCTEDHSFYVDNIQHAGSVFLGNYTPESAGDYASGTNHTLPTNGYARNYSGIHLDSFMKVISFQQLSKEGLQYLGKTIEIMAEAEQLYAHKNAVSIRLKQIKDEG